MGSLYKRGNVWWIKYYRNGVAMRESADTDKEGAAKKLLQKREGDIAHGIPVTPQTDRVTVGALLDDVLNDYKVNGKKSIADAKRNAERLADHFGAKRKAASITTADVRAYVAKRQSEEYRPGKRYSNATINRELSTLARAYSLGEEAGLITQAPAIKHLEERNVRTGFFERAQYEAVQRHIASHARPVVSFLFITGWRVNSEVLPLEWRRVDFKAGTVTLDPGTTKNGEGRVFPMTVELRRLLEWQRAYTDTVQRERGCIVPWVFHRDGQRMTGFRRTWKTACKKAGVPGRIRHDFRRTAVRNLVRAGIPERVAMTMTGHKTRSVFERYNIVSEGDLFSAAARLDEVAGHNSGHNRPENASEQHRARRA